MSFSHEAWVLFFALFALYSPLAALPSYLPVIRGLSHRQMVSLSLGLWMDAAGFVILAIWVGEPLLELLGISVAALTATGGIALGWEAIRLMLGHAGIVEELEPGQAERGEMPAIKPITSVREILFMPVTFPLTVGGTTFAFGVAASADVGSAGGRGWLTLAAICYGAVTGITIYLSGRLGARISLRGALLADRLAGLLLTAIAVILLANGFTDLVHHALHRLAPAPAAHERSPSTRRAQRNAAGAQQGPDGRRGLAGEEFDVVQAEPVAAVVEIGGEFRCEPVRLGKPLPDLARMLNDGDPQVRQAVLIAGPRADHVRPPRAV